MKVGVYFNAALTTTALSDPKKLLPTAGAFVEFYGRLSVMCVSLSVATVYAVGQVNLRIAGDTRVGPSLRMKFGFGAQLVVGLPVVGNVSVLYMVGVEIYVGLDHARTSPPSCCFRATRSCSAGWSASPSRSKRRARSRDDQADRTDLRRAGDLRPRHQHLPRHRHQLQQVVGGTAADRLARTRLPVSEDRAWKPTSDLRFSPFRSSSTGHVLRVNIVFLPRNQNPLDRHRRASRHPGRAAVRRREAVVRREDHQRALRIARHRRRRSPRVPLTTAQPAQAPDRCSRRWRAILRSPTSACQNTNANVTRSLSARRPRSSAGQSVKKYLPDSYRQSFNFVAPRTPNAVTDDAYHCAVRMRRRIPHSRRRRDQSAGDRCSPARCASRCSPTRAGHDLSDAAHRRASPISPRAGGSTSTSPTTATTDRSRRLTPRSSGAMRRAFRC